MIHSMCGGGLKDNRILSFAKVRFLNNPLAEARPYWYINNIKGLKAGDEVNAPFGKSGMKFKATVLRVDDNVSEQTAPLPIKYMSELNPEL